jgi:hypothetical protein
MQTAKIFLVVTTNTTLALMGDLVAAVKNKPHLLLLLRHLPHLHLGFVRTGLSFILSWEKNARL